MTKLFLVLALLMAEISFSSTKCLKDTTEANPTIVLAESIEAAFAPKDLVGKLTLELHLLALSDNANFFRLFKTTTYADAAKTALPIEKWQWRLHSWDPKKFKNASVWVEEAGVRELPYEFKYGFFGFERLNSNVGRVVNGEHLGRYGALLDAVIKKLNIESMPSDFRMGFIDYCIQYLSFLEIRPLTSMDEKGVILMKTPKKTGEAFYLKVYPTDSWKVRRDRHNLAESVNFTSAVINALARFANYSGEDQAALDALKADGFLIEEEFGIHPLGHLQGF